MLSQVEFDKLLSEFEALSPMRCFIVSSEEELAALKIAQQKEGRRLAAISTSGLKSPKVRVTFLPESAFKKEGEPDKPLARTMDLRDLVKFMSEGHSYDVAAERARDKYEFEGGREKADKWIKDNFSRDSNKN